jgi:hypothetical protein
LAKIREHHSWISHTCVQIGLSMAKAKDEAIHISKPSTHNASTVPFYPVTVTNPDHSMYVVKPQTNIRWLGINV